MSLSPLTRAAIRKGLKADLGNAEDNLVRARAAFRGVDLDQAHGMSGKMRGQIFEEYQAWYDQAKRALDEWDAA